MDGVAVIGIPLVKVRANVVRSANGFTYEVGIWRDLRLKAGVQRFG